MWATNAKHICNFKFSSSYIPKSRNKGEINFNNIFYLTQYIQNSISSICNHYKKNSEIFCVPFFHAKSLKFGVYFRLTTHHSADNSHT